MIDIDAYLTERGLAELVHTDVLTRYAVDLIRDMLGVADAAMTEQGFGVAPRVAVLRRMIDSCIPSPAEVRHRQQAMRDMAEQLGRVSSSLSVQLFRNTDKTEPGG